MSENHDYTDNSSNNIHLGDDLNKRFENINCDNVDPNHDSFTMNSEDFNIAPCLMATPTRDTAPTTPQRRSTVQDLPMRIRPTILLFGDSLTEYGFGTDNDDDDNNNNTGVGWASLLSHTYTRRADVLNRGFSGYTSNHAVSLVHRVFGVVPNGVLFMTLWLGANDAAIPGEPQHVALPTYKSNLKSLLRLLRSSIKEDHPILLLTPPPVDEVAWKQHCDDKYGDVSKESTRRNSLAQAYGEAVKEVAGMDMNCAVVDTWELLEGETPERGQYLSDGLHLNETGNRKVYQGIMATITKHYPKLLPMQDGDGKHGASGIPVEEKLWSELC